jgi:hypothetical protein
MPDFSRRTLLGIAPAIAILSVPREQLVLEAIAAERMPHQLLVSGVAPSDFFELRNYGGSEERLIAVLNRHGIWAALEENGRFLFPFESLAARERAWREVSADAEWIALAPRLSEIAIYRASSSGRESAQIKP